jgi:hypothetical protein
MENQILKTVVTVEFAADETGIAAAALSLIANARKGAKSENEAQTNHKPEPDPEPVRSHDREPEPARSRDREPEPEPKPARSRRRGSRNAAPEPEPEPEAGKDTGPEPENDEPGRYQNDVTHDDVRELMAGVIELEDGNRSKILKQLNRIGAKSVGAIKDEDLSDFFDFLQALKNS